MSRTSSVSRNTNGLSSSSWRSVSCNVRRTRIRRPAERGSSAQSLGHLQKLSFSLKPWAPLRTRYAALPPSSRLSRQVQSASPISRRTLPVIQCAHSKYCRNPGRRNTHSQCCSLAKALTPAAIDHRCALRLRLVDTRARTSPLTQRCQRAPIVTVVLLHAKKRSESRKRLLEPRMATDFRVALIAFRLSVNINLMPSNQRWQKSLTVVSCSILTVIKSMH